MNPSIRNLWLRRIAFAIFFVAVGMVVSFGLLATWLGTYPDNVDPKNIYYVLWKHGVNDNINLDSALVAMSHDVWPVKQVQGLSQDQLKARFGYIRSLRETTPYLQECYSASRSAGRAETQSDSKDVAFLRDSPWMVVMKNGKAAELVLCKGY